MPSSQRELCVEIRAEEDCGKAQGVISDHHRNLYAQFPIGEDGRSRKGAQGVGSKATVVAQDRRQVPNGCPCGGQKFPLGSKLHTLGEPLINRGAKEAPAHRPRGMDWMRSSSEVEGRLGSDPHGSEDRCSLPFPCRNVQNSM